MEKINIKTVANAISVYHSNKEKYKEFWEEAFETEENKLPSGSGIDKGCVINLDKSEPNKIVIDIPYHHMDENGFYCGWNDYQMILTPSFLFGVDIKIKVTCKGAEIRKWDREQTMDYLADIIGELLQ